MSDFINCNIKKEDKAAVQDVVEEMFGGGAWIKVSKGNDNKMYVNVYVVKTDAEAVPKGQKAPKGATAYFANYTLTEDGTMVGKTGGKYAGQPLPMKVASFDIVLRDALLKL